MLAKQQNVVVNVALPTNISQEIINKKGKEDNFKFPTMFSQCSYQEEQCDHQYITANINGYCLSFRPIKITGMKHAIYEK